MSVVCHQDRKTEDYALANRRNTAHRQDISLDGTKLALQVARMPGDRTSCVLFEYTDRALTSNAAHGPMCSSREIHRLVWAIVSGQHVTHSSALYKNEALELETELMPYHSEETVLPRRRGLHRIVTGYMRFVINQTGSKYQIDVQY